MGLNGNASLPGKRMEHEMMNGSEHDHPGSANHGRAIVRGAPSELSLAPLPGGVGLGNLHPDDGSPVGHSAQHLLARMLRYKWTAAIVFVLIAGSSIPAIWTFMVPKYRAKAVVRVSPRVDPLIFKTPGNGMVPLYNSYLNTQVAMIQHPAVLNRVVDPQEHPEIAATEWYQDNAASPFKTPLDPVNRLVAALSVRPRRKTELIDVSVTAKSAVDAKLLVNAVVGEYQKRDRDLQGESGQKTMQTLTQQLNIIRGEIDTEMDLRAKIIGEELITPDTEALLGEYATRIAQLQAEWKDLRRDMNLNEWMMGELAKAADARGEQAEPGAADTADGSPSEELRFAGDPEWRRRRDVLDASRHQLRLARERYGESHPRLQDLASDIEFAEARLKEYEDRLRERLAYGGQAVVDPASMELNPQEMMVFNQRKAQRQAELLHEDIQDQRDEARRTSRLAQELKKRDVVIDRKRQILVQIQAKIDALDMESNNPLARVSVVPAILPSGPSQDRRMVLTLMALFGGFAAGLGLAFLRASLDTSLRQADEVASAVRIPFLGQLPKVSPAAVLDTTDERLLEALRMVRTALLERVPAGKSCTVLITSPTPQAGKTSLTLLLGKSMAILGKRVLLVDTDLRRSSLTGRLRMEGEPGLTTILHGQARWEQVVIGSPIPGVDVIPVGKPTSTNDPELMANGVFAGCIAQWKKTYDFVLFDSPPVLPVADARILASQVDGTVLTLRAAHSRRHEATECLARLGAAGAQLFGTVLIGADARASSYYSGYGYYYSHRSTELLEANT
jgi:capsular exopolysaccharide synthesis family protein